MATRPTPPTSAPSTCTSRICATSWAERAVTAASSKPCTASAIASHPEPIMRRHLWFKLTGAFALIIFIGLIVTVWLASQGAATQFEHFMVANQMVRPATMQAALVNYYTRNGTWEGVDSALDGLLLGASDGMMSGMFGSMMGMPANRIQVLDRKGVVVADSAAGAGGEPLTAA